MKSSIRLINAFIRPTQATSVTNVILLKDEFLIIFLRCFENLFFGKKLSL